MNKSKSMHCLRIYLVIVILLGSVPGSFGQSFIIDKAGAQTFSLNHAAIYVDSSDFATVKKAAGFLQQDFEAVTGKKLSLVSKLPSGISTLIIIGSIERSALIRELIAAKKINTQSINNRWEAYQIKTLENPVKGIANTLVIAGSDRRGTAFGVVELSRQMGVSPWYWWSDVPVQQKKELHARKGMFASDAPKVKYRGIFINDEAPALSNWSKEKFGGFNHKFYSKVFELMLRLKSNYLWPAMWGNAFYDDDPKNIEIADEYGIVIGTSHHEPLMRAHDEWRRYGKGQKWNYDSTEAGIKEFWQSGMKRASNEKIVSLGMRGDGDAPMSRETATSLLERIVKDQRVIIEQVTGKPADQTPQLWALYKEVQDYYDKGMRVPDDVTLLLCDDNWGNIRRLPHPDEKPRKGGYGIYYHFDYVGGPRNYKWVNTNPIPRVWEQMHLAWEYNARQIWIVNVGDIKPMEFPISFFLDYAWNPEKIGADDLQKYTEEWAAAQFGKPHAKEIADIISKYTKHNGRRKPELLGPDTYSIPYYGEADRVVLEFKSLLTKAELVNKKLSPEYRDAYFQLVLHPVKACANLHEMYRAVAVNRLLAARKNPDANSLADQVKQLYLNDSLITLQYHQLGKGKWNHMMSQTHIGYTYWQQPPRQTMPEVKYVTEESGKDVIDVGVQTHPRRLTAESLVPAGSKGNIFFEKDGYVSLEASNYTKAIHAGRIQWKILPDHGKTGSAITVFPVTAARQSPGSASAHLQYEVYVYDTGICKVNAYFSPTLNLHNDDGLKYAMSIDDEPPQVMAINKDDNNVRIWERWVANNIIINTSEHRISTPGKHVIKYWMVNPCVVLQKIVIDFGGVRPSYLGPPETKIKP